MTSRIKYWVVSASTCLVVLLVAGSLLGQGAAQSDNYKQLGVFSDVVARIKSDYVEEPDMKSVTLGALNGLLEAVDPFASYLNADQYKDYLASKDAKRPEVGLILSKKFGYMSVVGTVPDSPAAKAGFTMGDIIESIKGISTRDMPLAYAGLLLQGAAGSEVELGVVRVRHPEPETVKLTRAALSIPPVEGKMLPGQVGYLDINALTGTQVKQAAAAIEKLQKDGAQKLVVDLRDCVLGSPDDGVAFANLFVSKGRLAYYKGQKVAEQDVNADASKAITTLPTAVLVNHGTADAAEIAASAMNDNKRAQLVGERTYGDAAVRRAITMDDGGAIILSVAKYYSADGKAIQDSGVTPGNVVAEPEPQVDVDENGEPLPTSQEPQQPKKTLDNDPVLKKALEVLGSARG
ncbi:MAG TPA: S41 family peptidase [Bryobacteraceae bacterium]|nr:S41 family peptidase [Bryobacteraceae bacterium]